MGYEIWTEIVEVLSREPDRVFSLDELEEETNIDRENLQQALYRAYRRHEVDRIAPGLYRFHDKYRNTNNVLKTKSQSNFQRIHIKSPDYGYEIKIPKVNIQIIDEIIGQLKYIRNQMAHK